MPQSRRTLLTGGAAALLAPLLRRTDAAAAGSSRVAAPPTPPDTYPAHAPDLAREMVAVSHGNVARVKELVERHPALARAAWDWGFGDWEDALGAASHVGNRPIAEVLLASGARPTIFSAAMLGQLDVVQAFVQSAPGIQRVKGPHGITLVAHARAGGDAARPVLEYLTKLGDADQAQTSETLSEGEAALAMGTYTFGTAPNQRVTIGQSKGFLTFLREGGSERVLFHLGSLVFHPTGAPAVRVAFKQEGDQVVLTVRDPDVQLTATRKLGARALGSLAQRRGRYA